jgi:hypothetical protein
MVCSCCNKPLNQSQYSGNLKSCPCCSTRNGQEHVFYPYPAAFGVTEKRSSANHTDGPQSYCVACRGGKENPNYNRIVCSNK